MITFKYFITLKDGYKPVMETEKENEIEFTIQAKNRATADRMVKALFTENNVIEWDGIAVDE